MLPISYQSSIYYKDYPAITGEAVIHKFDEENWDQKLSQYNKEKDFISFTRSFFGIARTKGKYRSGLNRWSSFSSGNIRVVLEEDRLIFKFWGNTRRLFLTTGIPSLFMVLQIWYVKSLPDSEPIAEWILYSPIAFWLFLYVVCYLGCYFSTWYYFSGFIKRVKRIVSSKEAL